MERMSCGKKKGYCTLFVILVWLLAFQSPLESLWGPLAYMDELVALMGAALCAYDIVIVRKCHFTRQMLWFGGAMLLFVAAGVAGNLIYRYQPLKCVAVDLYTNLKFFFAIAAGYYLFREIGWEELEKTANCHARIIVTAVFCVFLADRFFNFYPCEVRHGIKSAKLFFFHPTYLAGAMAFLTVLLTAFYEKKNLPFIAMALCMMAFTMRSKALASVAAYVAIFLFFAVFKRQLKLGYVIAAGVLCCVVAWPQIRYYYVELGGRSTRSVMIIAAIWIARDYFPIGTGFGTYASAEASKHFSPVYDIYNFEYLLRFERNRQWVHFLNDSFWPIIIGQTGVIGTAAYLVMMGILIKDCLSLKNFSVYAYVGTLFSLAYLFISSAAEPAFNNATAIPLAFMIGIALAHAKNSQGKEEKSCLKTN